MEGKGRGLEGKGAAGGVCACLFGGVLMRSVGRGAVCVGPHDARRRRTCCQDKRWAIKGQGEQGWDAGEGTGTGQLWGQPSACVFSPLLCWGWVQEEQAYRRVWWWLSKRWQGPSDIPGCLAEQGLLAAQKHSLVSLTLPWHCWWTEGGSDQPASPRLE